MFKYWLAVLPHIFIFQNGDIFPEIHQITVCLCLCYCQYAIRSVEFNLVIFIDQRKINMSCERCRCGLLKLCFFIRWCDVMQIYLQSGVWNSTLLICNYPPELNLIIVHALIMLTLTRILLQHPPSTSNALTYAYMVAWLHDITWLIAYCKGGTSCVIRTGLP